MGKDCKKAKDIPDRVCEKGERVSLFGEGKAEFVGILRSHYFIRMKSIRHHPLPHSQLPGELHPKDYDSIVKHCSPIRSRGPWSLQHCIAA